MPEPIQEGEVSRKKLNIDSEVELSSKSDEDEKYDSNDEDFLMKQIPPYQPEFPACFCEGGKHCEQHQGREPTVKQIVKLLKN